MIAKKTPHFKGTGITQRAKTWFRKRIAPIGLVLMYHRVSAEELDPWGLNVTPDHFAEQMEVLKKSYQPLSLGELVEARKENRIPNRSVVITFDDGYRDNLYNARPILEKYQVPAVVFLITGSIGSEREFWWDALGRALLKPERLPGSLQLKISGKDQAWQLGSAEGYPEAQRRADGTMKPWDARPGTRLAFFYDVWQNIGLLPELDRRAALDEIMDWVGAQEDIDPANFPLSDEEVRQLRQGGLIELGAHTETHPSLPELSPSEQRVEIQRSKARLEELLGCPVPYFSYPHGDYTAMTAALTQEAGFHCACTTLTETVWERTDLFQLPRFQVEDWDGKTFERRMSRWFKA